MTRFTSWAPLSGPSSSLQRTLLSAQPVETPHQAPHMSQLKGAARAAARRSLLLPHPISWALETGSGRTLMKRSLGRRPPLPTPP